MIVEYWNNFIYWGNYVMNGIVESVAWELGKWAFNWFLCTFFWKHYIEYMKRQMILKWIAEAEAEKQLKVFLENPDPMAAFIQAENELEYRNMFKTLIKALPKISKKTPDENKINFDVMTRLKNLSKDFSSDDMQEIVAWILAWEYNQPWTFSLRTLEVVRSLTKDDIELFKKFCWFVFNWKFYLINPYTAGSKYSNNINIEWIWYDVLNYLQDLWLVSNNNSTLTVWNIENETNQIFPIQDCKLEYRIKWQYPINVSSLTIAWVELFSIVWFDSNEILINIVDDYLKNFFWLIHKNS